MWIKICGLTSEDAIAAALEARADAVGFIFAPSVRRLTPEQAARLAAPARGRAHLIAVAMHPGQALVDEILTALKPDALQTDLADFEHLRLPDGLTRLPVVRNNLCADGKLPLRFLFEGARSGSGEVSDWKTAALLARQSELVLAGGLNAGNVAAAIHAVRPYGVDVSSGVESAPGRKSVQKITQFVAAARAAFHEAAAHGDRCSE
jgi:phosphoribosylanthranilate isomerase